MQPHHYTQLYNTYATKDLELLLHSAPYFGAGHIVLAKKYYNEKNIAFNEQLKLASLYTADRKVLYSFIHQPIINKVAVANEIVAIENEYKPIITETKTLQPTVVIDNSAMYTLAQSILNADDAIINTNKANAQLAQLVDDVLLNDVTNIINTTPESIVITQNIEPLSIEGNIVPIIDTDIQIIETILVTTNFDNVIVIDESITKTIVAEKVIVLTEEVIVIPIVIETPIVEIEKITPNKNYKLIHINDTISFFDWLNIGTTSVIETNSQQVTPAIATENKPELAEKTFAEKNAEFKKRKKTLIEKFIIDEPRITPGKAKMYSPAEKAKESVAENDDLVSETLVSIYTKQGMYRKAIKSLHKLSEKYPEKSTYFANQILTIKEYLLNNNIKY
ncbi:MAG: hypothetical protein H7331_11265 [Bacteroidia bacterium]|nr:hypothetical protein [Bacteroidia bacterium]